MSPNMAARNRCACKMLVDRTDLAHHVRHKGLAGGSSCEVAVFRSWKPREIARLATKGIFASDNLASLAAEIIGTDMQVREHMLFIGLDKRNRVIAVGDGSSTEKHLCMFLLMDAFASMVGSTSKPGDIGAVIMAHNHPSGTPYPSEDDIKTTERVLERFKIVPLLDHGIVYLDASGKPGLYSFVEDKPRLFR